MNLKKNKGDVSFRWRKLYWATAGFYGLYFGMMGFYVIQLPYFFKTTLNLSSLQIGILFGTMPIAKFLTPFHFLKRGLEIGELKIGIAIGMIGGLLLLTLVYPLLLIAFFLLGVSFSILPPFVEKVAVERLGHSYGKARLVGSLTFLIASFATPSGSLLLGIFLFLLLTSSLLTLFLYNFQLKPSSSKKVQFLWKKGWNFWVALILMKTATVGFYTFFTIHIHQQGLENYLGLFWGVSIGAEVFLFLFQPKIMSHFSPMEAMEFALLATAIRWFILCLFPSNLFLTTVAQLLHATTFALFHIGAMAYLNSTYSNKTLAQQFYGGLGYGLSWFIGNWFAGILYPYHLFCWEGGLTLIALGVLAIGGKGRN